MVVVFALAMVVVQLAKVSFDAATTTWLADRVPFGRRSEVTGLVETSWALALLVGIPVLGLVVDRWGWRAGEVVIGVLCAIAAFGVWRRIPVGAAPGPGVLHPDALLDEAVGGPVAPRAVAAVADAPTVVSDRPWWRIPARHALTLAAVALLMGAVQLVVVVEGVWFEDAFGFSTAGIGGAVFFIGIAELIGSLGSSRLTDRVGKRRSMVVGALVMMPAMAALGLVGPNAVVGIAVVAVGTLGFEYALVSAFPLVAELDVAARATMFSLMLAAGTAMRGVADAGGALIYDAGGIAAVGLTSAGVVAVVLRARGAGGAGAARRLTAQACGARRLRRALSRIVTKTARITTAAMASGRPAPRPSRRVVDRLGLGLDEAHPRGGAVGPDQGGGGRSG